MVKPLALVALLVGAARADGFVVGARLGGGHIAATIRGEDVGAIDPTWGFAAGIDGGYVAGRLRFSLGYDYAVFRERHSGYDMFLGESYQFDETEHFVSFSAKVQVDIIPDMAFAWGAIGVAGVHAYEWGAVARTELGVGFRSWLDPHDALRFDLSWVNVSPWDQYGGAAGFEHDF